MTSPGRKLATIQLTWWARQPTSFALWASLLKDWEVLPPAAAEDPWRVRTDGLEMPLPEPEMIHPRGRLETDKALPALLGLRAALIEAKLGYEMARALRARGHFVSTAFGPPGGDGSAMGAPEKYGTTREPKNVPSYANYCGSDLSYRTSVCRG